MNRERHQKRIEERIIREALSGVTRIKAFIHTVKFSSADLDYGEIEKKVGPLFIPTDYNHRIPKYRHAAYRQLNNGSVTIYFEPLKGCMPSTYITTSSAKHRFLSELHKLIPDLTLSYVEYTIDLFCKDHIDVANLFYVLRKNIHFPYANKTTTKGGQLTGMEIRRTKNALFQVNFLSRSRYLKVYERGKDGKKSDTPKRKIGRWEHKDCDRVRIEYVYKRPRLKGKGPYTLDGLMKNPNFGQIIGLHNGERIINEIRFKKFKHQAGLPQFWEDYTAKDDKGNADCFIEEYLQAKENGICNISQYVEDHDSFSSLTKKIGDAIIKFNERWIKKSNRARIK